MKDSVSDVEEYLLVQREMHRPRKSSRGAAFLGAALILSNMLWLVQYWASGNANYEVEYYCKFEIMSKTKH